MRVSHDIGGSDMAPLAGLATRQHGTISRRQLRALSFTDRMIDRLIASGHLIPIHAAVYAVGHGRLTLRGRWMAAVLACGDGARLSHGDAVALHDLRRAGPGDVHVTAPALHRVPGVRCHTTRVAHRLGAAVIDAIPVTGLERTVLDEAVHLPAQRLRGLLEEVERRDRFDLRRFRAELDLSNGHRGVGRLRLALAALADLPPDLRSTLEEELLLLVREADLPEPVTNVVVAGEVFDFHWPAHRVIVEVDSWRYHRSRRSFEDDRRRANAAALAGQTLLRVTDERIRTAPESVVRELTVALRGG